MLQPEEKEESKPKEQVPEQTPEQIQLVHIEKELKECQEKYLRLLAESENARKRMQKERQETTRYAVENVIAEFLHPLDSFEKALKFAESGSEDVKNWAIGFEMILEQFKQVLSHHGVTTYDSLGKPFDPHFHEAVEVVETSDHPPETVVQEFLRGYRIGDRIIRHARVKVAKQPQKPEESNKG